MLSVNAPCSCTQRRRLIKRIESMGRSILFLYKDLNSPWYTLTDRNGTVLTAQTNVLIIDSMIEQILTRHEMNMIRYLTRSD